MEFLPCDLHQTIVQNVHIPNEMSEKLLMRNVIMQHTNVDKCVPELYLFCIVLNTSKGIIEYILGVIENENILY